MKEHNDMPKKSYDRDIEEHSDHKEHRSHHEHKHVPSESNPWMIVSVILGILLVASVATQGFDLRDNVTKSVDMLAKVMATTASEKDRTTLNTAITTLNNLKGVEPVKQPTTKPTDEKPADEKPSEDGTAADKVQIVEFSDFECPFCGRAAPTIKQLQEEYGDKIELTFKHFPLSFHPNAQGAAQASECARDQGKFWEYHDILYANQQSLNVENYKKWAGELGLDTEKFNTCVDSGEKADVVKADFTEGTSKGVGGTPTFFINGNKVVGAQPYDVFKAAVDAALKGEAPPAPTPTPTPTPTVATVGVDDDPMIGSDDAKVVIVEFSDFECPFCSRFVLQTMPQIIEEYVDTGKVKVVFRDFPLGFHPMATPAAEASECADEQGKFWEFHDKLFDNQDTLSVANFKVWADELGMDAEQFNDCVDTRKYEDEVESDSADGSEAGITGTPGFIIGVLGDDGETVTGVQVKGAQPFAAFQTAIEGQLEKI